MKIYDTLFFAAALCVASLQAELVEETEQPIQEENNVSDQNDENVVDSEVATTLEAEGELHNKDNVGDEQSTSAADDDITEQRESELTNFINSDLSDSETPEDDEENGKNIVEYSLPEAKESSAAQEVESFDALMMNAIELTEINVQLLNKQSAKAEDIKMIVNKPLEYGGLTIVLKRAFMTAEDVIPFGIVGYFEVYENKKLIFNNWMCSTYPSAVTFDHQIYDIKINNEKD